MIAIPAVREAHRDRQDMSRTRRRADTQICPSHTVLPNAKPVLFQTMTAERPSSDQASQRATLSECRQRLPKDRRCFGMDKANNVNAQYSISPASSVI